MCLNNTGKWVNLTGRDILFMGRAHKGYGGLGTPTKKSSVMAAICLKMQIWSLNYSFPFFPAQLSWWRLLHHVYLYVFSKLNIAFLYFCQYLDSNILIQQRQKKMEEVILLAEYLKEYFLHIVHQKYWLWLWTLRSKVKTNINELLGFFCCCLPYLWICTVLLFDQFLFTPRATQLCARCNLLKMIQDVASFQNLPSFTCPLRENKTPSKAGEKPKESTLRVSSRAARIRSPVASQIAVVTTSPRGFTWWRFVHGAWHLARFHFGRCSFHGASVSWLLHFTSPWL